MNYNAIIFDLDQTLINLKPRFVDAMLGCFRDYDVVVSASDSRLAKLWVHQYWAQYPQDSLNGETFSQRFVMPLLAEIGQTVGDVMAQSITNCFVDRYQPIQVLMPGVKETLTALRQNGVIIGILSNRETAAGKDLLHLDIADLVDFSLTAGQVGVWKPQPELFLAALRHADNLTPDTTLYVGDNYYADVLGARGAGIDGLLVDYEGIYQNSNMDCPIINRIEDLLVFID